MFYIKQIDIHTVFLFINSKNLGSKELWESLCWQVIQDIKCMYKEF